MLRLLLPQLLVEMLLLLQLQLHQVRHGSSGQQLLDSHMMLIQHVALQAAAMKATFQVTLQQLQLLQAQVLLVLLLSLHRHALHVFFK